MDLPSHPVHDLGTERPETVETVGSKEKSWFRYDGALWLFKANRVDPNTGKVDGDDWAEVVAADLAMSLGLPHAKYELATRRGQRGILSRRFVTKGRRLVHGNELFVEYARLPDYPVTDPRKFSRVPQYTPDLVVKTLTRLDVKPNPDWMLPAGVVTGADVVVGYLMLDALIANTDRHDQNWAVEERLGNDIPGPDLMLAPTFDHASSLGRSLVDSKRLTRLSATAPPHNLAAFLARPSSRFHRSAGIPDILTPFDAFRLVSDHHTTAAAAWLDRLASMDPDTAFDSLRRIPADRISDAGVAFASALVAFQRDALLALRPHHR